MLKATMTTPSEKPGRPDRPDSVLHKLESGTDIADMSNQAAIQRWVLHAGSSVVQRMFNEELEEHNVAESTMAEDRGDRSLAASIAGCAAIKVIASVRGKPVANVAFHSEGDVERTLAKAAEIAALCKERIKAVDGKAEDARIDVVSVIKAPLGQEIAHSKVLAVFAKAGFPVNQETVRLEKNLPPDDFLKVDLTGSSEEIKGRVKDLVLTSEERGEKRDMNLAYRELLIQRRAAGRSQRRVKQGRRFWDNPDFVEAMSFDDFLLLDYERSQKELARLKRAMEVPPPGGWGCTIQ